MTEAQEQAFVKIEEIMREHFNSGVFVVAGDMPAEENTEIIRCGWHGGAATAVGMFAVGQRKAMHDVLDEDD